MTEGEWFVAAAWWSHSNVVILGLEIESCWKIVTFKPLLDG